MARFGELASDECPFDPPPPPPTRKIAHWVRPEMVVEVAFAEWTHEDILRQPSYLAERDDKNPKKVVARSDARARTASAAGVAEAAAAVLAVERVDDG